MLKMFWNSIFIILLAITFMVLGCANIPRGQGGGSSSSQSSSLEPFMFTIAGTLGSSGTNGDGDFATNAQLKNPQGVYLDSVGNIYIADTQNHAIRKINVTNSKINTVAGILGKVGTTGDGGLATSAKLNYPANVYIDLAGNIFITDAWNHAIRKVNASDGKINTVAGILGSNGSSGDGGLAINADLYFPTGVFIDSAENIFIADAGNNAIRKVSTDGNINTIAGILGVSGITGDGGSATTARLNGPAGVCVDFAGKIYIADSGNNAIRLVK